MMAQLVSWTEPAFHLVSTPGTGGTSVPFMPCGKPFGTTGILPWLSTVTPKSANSRLRR